MEKMAKYPYIEGSKDCCPCAPTIPDWIKTLFDAGIIIKDDDKKPDLIVFSYKNVTYVFCKEGL